MVETKAIVFDLDDTLAPSKQAIPVEMAHELVLLARQFEVGILTGGQYRQVEQQVLAYLPKSVADRVHVFGCSGSQYRLANGDVTTEMIPDAPRKRLITIMEKVAMEMGYWVDNPAGPIIEDRLAQITYSALGQKASPEAKSGWDADKVKRSRMVDRLVNLVDDYDFRIGGSTSIDVTLKGRDKAYGMDKFLNLVGVEPFETVYVGDSFTNHGNDFPVLSTGVFCIEMVKWEDTLNLVRWLNRG